jgi:hypothetical protein
MTAAEGRSPARHDAPARFLPAGEICNSRGSRRARPDMASEHATTLRPPWPGHVTGQSSTFVSRTPGAVLRPEPTEAADIIEQLPLSNLQPAEGPARRTR